MGELIFLKGSSLLWTVKISSLSSNQLATKHHPVPHRCVPQPCDVTRGRGQWWQRYADPGRWAGYAGRRHTKPQYTGKNKKTYDLSWFEMWKSNLFFVLLRARRFPLCWMTPGYQDTPPAQASRSYWSATTPSPQMEHLTMDIMWVGVDGVEVLSRASRKPSVWIS